MFSPPGLESRGISQTNQNGAILLAAWLFWEGRPRPAIVEIWNNQIRTSTFRSLSYANIVDYMRGRGSDLFNSLGWTQGPRYLICNLEQVNEAIDGGGGSWGSGIEGCYCVRSDCCLPSDDECINAIPDQARIKVKRGAAKPYTWDVTDPQTGILFRMPWRAPTVSTFPSSFNHKKSLMPLTRKQYHSPGELKSHSTLYTKLGSTWMFDVNCARWLPVTFNALVNGRVAPKTESESCIEPFGHQPAGMYRLITTDDHPVERQMLQLWGDAALVGKLRDVDGSDFEIGGVYHNVPFNFFSATMQTVLPPIGNFQDRIMNALGSKQNPGPMATMRKNMNLIKKQMWVNHEDLVAHDRMSRLVIDANTLPDVLEGKEYLRQVSLSFVISMSR